jgi:hypothetical protein
VMYLINIVDIDKLLNPQSLAKTVACIEQLPLTPMAAIVVDNGRFLGDYEIGMKAIEPYVGGFLITVQDSYAEGEGRERLTLGEYVDKFEVIVKTARRVTNKHIVVEVGNEVDLPPPYQSPDIWSKVEACIEAASPYVIETAVTFFWRESQSAFLAGKPRLTFDWAMASCYPTDWADLKMVSAEMKLPSLQQQFLDVTGGRKFAIREYGTEEFKGTTGNLTRSKLISTFDGLGVNGGGYWDFQKHIVGNTMLTKALGDAWMARGR